MPPKMLRAEFIDDLRAAEALREEWDGLAVACSRPFSAPAWMLAWWRHARPPASLLRIITVRDGDELVGVIPFFAQPGSLGPNRYRLLAGSVSAHVEPLARSGLERDVADRGVDLLLDADPPPHLVIFEGISRTSPWPALFTREESRRKRTRIYRGRAMPAPHLTLEGRTYEEWFAALSGRRRTELRRRARRLAEAGAEVRLAATPGEAVRRLSEFAELHHARWRARGGSAALDPQIERMLADAATELVPSLRFRLWSIEIQGKPISSLVFLAAGGEVSYWLGGFDERWAAYAPAIEAVRAALEHAWQLRDRRMDFGAGGQAYKYTFAEGEETVESVNIVPPSDRSALTRLQLLPERLGTAAVAARHRAFRRLSPGTQQRVKALAGRLRRRRLRGGA